MQYDAEYDRHNSKWSSMSIHGNWLPGFIVIHWNTETLRQKQGETFDDISKILRFSVCTFSGLRICIGPTPEVHQGGEKRPTEDDQKRHHDRHVPCSRKVPGPNAQRSQHAADLKSTKGCYSDLITQSHWMVLWRTAKYIAYIHTSSWFCIKKWSCNTHIGILSTDFC